MKIISIPNPNKIYQLNCKIFYKYAEMNNDIYMEFEEVRTKYWGNLNILDTKREGTYSLSVLSKASKDLLINIYMDFIKICRKYNIQDEINNGSE